MPKTVYYSKKYRTIAATRPRMSEGVAEPRRNIKMGPVIMVACLLVAAISVLLVPLMVGGAVPPETSRTASAAQEAPRNMAEYADVGQALTVLNIQAAVPAVLPEGYVQKSVHVVDDSVLEIVYMSGSKEIVFRTAAGTDDVSGEDYNGYAYTATETVGDVARGYAGVSDKKLALAVWAHGGYSYAIVAKNGMSPEAMRAMAESIA